MTLSPRHKLWLYRTGLALAIAFLILTVTNASWLAPTPAGAPKLIAHRGISQLYDKAGVERDTCTADRIEEPVHDYLENTVRSIQDAVLVTGAQAVEIDIAPTADGEIAVFHDWTLDCRTQGSGDTRDATLAELQALDPGYGYTADQGESFPLRGQSDARIPTLEEALAALPRTPIIFNFKSKDAGEADLLAEKLIAAGRDPVRRRDGFYGHANAVERIREHFPEAWAWTADELEECSRDYVAYAWSGYLPQSCRGRTLLVPLDYQWPFWGWPNRAIARMEAHGGRVLMIGPLGVENHPRGLAVPEQLGEIPSTYNGYVWVEDIWTIGPALRPTVDKRNQAQREAADTGLAVRRARLGLD